VKWDKQQNKYVGTSKKNNDVMVLVYSEYEKYEPIYEKSGEKDEDDDELEVLTHWEKKPATDRRWKWVPLDKIGDNLDEYVKFEKENEDDEEPQIPLGEPKWRMPSLKGTEVRSLALKNLLDPVALANRVGRDDCEGMPTSEEEMIDANKASKAQKTAKKEVAVKTDPEDKGPSKKKGSSAKRATSNQGDTAERQFKHTQLEQQIQSLKLQLDTQTTFGKNTMRDLQAVQKQLAEAKEDADKYKALPYVVRNVAPDELEELLHYETRFNLLAGQVKTWFNAYCNFSQLEGGKKRKYEEVVDTELRELIDYKRKTKKAKT